MRDRVDSEREPAHHRDARRRPARGRASTRRVRPYSDGRRDPITTATGSSRPVTRPIRVAYRTGGGCDSSRSGAGNESEWTHTASMSRRFGRRAGARGAGRRRRRRSRRRAERIAHPVPERLVQVLFLDLVGTREVGDRARQAKHTVLAPAGEVPQLSARGGGVLDTLIRPPGARSDLDPPGARDALADAGSSSRRPARRPRARAAAAGPARRPGRCGRAAGR